MALAAAACSDATGVNQAEVIQDGSLQARGPSPQPNKQACTDPEDPNCLPGDNDPNPGAPGRYFDVAGATMSRSWCESNGNDLDDDGIADMCERRLASYFRPQMRSSVNDNLLGEPYYLVERGYYGGLDASDQLHLQGQPDLVGNPYRIMYLLAYYEDLGTGCVDPVPYCDHHHFGDSEYVVLDVRYDVSTKHWLVQAMFGSRHGSLSGWRRANELQYPEEPRGYPRVWVSTAKHANYVSFNACDAGSFGYEKCNSPRFDWRPPVNDLTNNIGSRLSPAPDVPYGVEGNTETCVQSRDPERREILGLTKRECFWRPSVNFSGWKPGEVGVTGYREILDHFVGVPF